MKTTEVKHKYEIGDEVWYLNGRVIKAEIKTIIFYMMDKKGETINVCYCLHRADMSMPRFESKDYPTEEAAEQALKEDTDSGA